MAFTEEEIRIVQERRAARAARAAREAAGLPEEPELQKKRPSVRRLALGKVLLIVFMGGVVVLAVAMLWNYGTLSPCEALTQALHGAVLRETARKATQPVETFGPEPDVRSLLPAIDLRIEALSPAECTKALVQFEMSSENSFVGWFLAQSPP
jgi:hypothetical protein